MPRETAAAEPSAAVKSVPPTPLSPSQMRVLLNALRHKPVGVVTQVGFLLMLFVALVEASIPDNSAPPAASIAGRPADKGARHGNVVATNEGKDWAANIIAFAKVKRAREGRLMGEGGDVKVRYKGVPNFNVETLQRWAVQSNRRVPNLLRLLRATPGIGIGGALLVQYHADGISPREAAKALAAAARVLTYVSGVSEAKLRGPRQAAVAIQVFWRTGRFVRSQWREDHRFAEINEAAHAAVRLQALAREDISRREAKDAKKTAAATRRTSEARGQSARSGEGRSEAVRRAVEAANTLAEKFQGYACGTPVRWRDEALLRRSTSALGIQFASETASSAFGPRRCTTWRCGQAQMGAKSLRGSVKARKVPSSRMTVANMAKRSLDARSLNEKVIDMDWAGDTPRGGTSINDLPAPTSKSPPTSDSIASSNRSSDHSSTTSLGVEPLGSQPTPSTHTDGEQLAANDSSTQPSLLDGHSADMTHPPDHGRPVRLPIDEPVLFFAPIPIIFDLTPYTTATSSPDRDGPKGNSLPLSVNDEADQPGHGEVSSPREVHLAPALERRPPPLREDNLPPALERIPPPYDDNFADNDSGQGSPRSSSVGEASVLRRINTVRDSGLIDGTLSAAGSMVEVGRVSTLSCDSNDAAYTCMLWSREEGSLRSNSLGLRSESGSEAHETSDDTSDGSVDLSDPPAPPALTSAMSPAPPSPIESTSSSLLGLGNLGSRSSSSVQLNDEETKDYTPFSTPPPRDGQSSDTSNSRPFNEEYSRAELRTPSPRGRHLPDRTPPAETRSPSLSLFTPPRRDGNSSSDTSSSPGSPCSATPPLRDRPGASFSQQTPLDVTTDAFFSRNSLAIGTRTSHRTSPTGTRPPSLRLDTPPTTLLSRAGRWRLCEGSSSPTIAVERPGGRSRWVSFSGATTISHAVRTPPPLPGWLQAAAGDVGANLTEEENTSSHPEPSASDSDLTLSARKTEEVIRYSTAARARSFLERARLAADRDRDRVRNSSSHVFVSSKGDRSPTSNPTRLLDEVRSGTYVVADALNTTTESNSPNDPDVAIIASSAPSSEDPMNPSLLDIDLSESAPTTPSAYAKGTTLPPPTTARGDPMNQSLDGLSSADGVHSTSERGQSVCCSPIAEPPSLSFAEKPALRLAVDKMMEDWERDTTGGVSGQLTPIVEEPAAIPLDQAVVRPSPDGSTHVGEAKGVAADVQVYGALPLEAPRTPSPSGRHSPYRTPTLGIPPSPARSTPSVHSPPRKRRRRKGSSSSSSTRPGAGRPRNLSRSVSAVPDARYNATNTTPPFSPDRLRAAGAVGGGAGLADDGGRQGSVPGSFVGEASAFLRSDTGDSDNSGFMDGGAVSAAGSFVEEVRRVSTLYDSDDANAPMLWSLEEGSFRANSLGLISDWDSEFSSGPAPSSTASLPSAPLSDVGDMGGADIASDWDSEFSSGPAPPSTVSLPSAPMSDVGSIDVDLSDVGLSDVSLRVIGSSDVGFSDVGFTDVRSSGVDLSVVGLSDVGSSDVDLSDVDLDPPPLLETPTATLLPLDGSTSAASPSSATAAAQQAESKEKSVERTAFGCFVGEPKSGDAVPLHGLPRSVGKGGRHHTEGAASDVAGQHHVSAEDTYRKQICSPSAGVEEFKWSGLPNNNI